PIHCFDLDKITNLEVEPPSFGGSTSKLIIRDAGQGERITTLDGKEIILNSNNLIIADSVNPLAIAGIKGGKKAEIDKNTKNIIIEVANFDATSIRKTARSIGIFTEAVKRFENNLSPELGDLAMKEISSLIKENCSCPETIFEEVVDIYPKKQELRKLSFHTDKISKILGITLSDSKIEKILKQYKYQYSKIKIGEFKIIIPLMRLDLTIEEDMAEEIGRILGYDKVKPKIPKINFKSKKNEIYQKICVTRNKLLAEGYSEVMTYVFCNSGKVEILESASDKKFLRTNLTDGLKESMKLNKNNAALLDMEQVKIFEIGTVFPTSSVSGEEIHVAYGNKSGIAELSLEEFCSTFNSSAEVGLTHQCV
ncbi:MAG: phenylalanine--tRNA ligase beta subunit-related protein, partial [Patescibacteria group bacterium]